MDYALCMAVSVVVYAHGRWRLLKWMGLVLLIFYLLTLNSTSGHDRDSIYFFLEWQLRSVSVHSQWAMAIRSLKSVRSHLINSWSRMMEDGSHRKVKGNLSISLSDFRNLAESRNGPVSDSSAHLHRTSAFQRQKKKMIFTHHLLGKTKYLSHFGRHQYWNRFILFFFLSSGCCSSRIYFTYIFVSWRWRAMC